MKRMCKVLTAAFFLAAFSVSSFADGSASLPLSFNRSTSLLGNANVGENVGAMRDDAVTINDTQTGAIYTIRAKKQYMFVRAAGQWRQGDVLTYDTAMVTDTGIMRLRRINAGQDTGNFRPLVAIGQNLCDTSSFCWVTWSGPETNVLVNGTWTMGAQLVPTFDGGNALTTLRGAFTSITTALTTDTPNLQIQMAVSSTATAAQGGTVGQRRTVWIRQ